MPPWHLEAHSEHELCFATYYDISAQVPKEFQDPTGTMFRFSANDLRQDPQGHHLILNRYIGTADDIHDASLRAWTCNGGDKSGQPCEPTDLTSCGSGICTSGIKQSFACIGFGPGAGGQSFYAIGGAQKAQATTEFADGVFAQVPMKGILYWNSHAFNLTDQDTTMHARLNYAFAKNPKFPVGSIFDTSKIFAANAAPYKTQTLCNNYVLPQGARLFSLSSHTHKHGKDFTVTDPSGKLIYESFVYNDPLTQTYNPPLSFDAADPKQRTLHYCSLYNNGVAADGSPDPNTVTRRSRLPQSAQNTIGMCTPVACTAGKIGTRCRGVGDDRTWLPPRAQTTACVTPARSPAVRAPKTRCSSSSEATTWTPPPWRLPTAAGPPAWRCRRSTRGGGRLLPISPCRRSWAAGRHTLHTRCTPSTPATDRAAPCSTAPLLAIRAVVVAAVGVDRVAVVTLLAGFFDAVAAHGQRAGNRRLHVRRADDTVTDRRELGQDI